MITRFGSLFAGHVDLDDHGLDATPVNERWLPDEQLVTVFDKATAIATLMDRTGYDVFWLAEHHFQREGYEVIPNILMLSVHLAHLTRRIKFGCGFNIVPMWHPLRLAEDYATADYLTGGRVLFGVGRGYHTREVETSGAPMLDPDANRELCEEQVEIIFKAWQEALARQGRQTEPGGDLVVGIMFHIAESEEEAIRQARPFFEEWMKMFAPLGFVPGLSDEQIRALGDPSLARRTPLPTLEE